MRKTLTLPTGKCFLVSTSCLHRPCWTSVRMCVQMHDYVNVCAFTYRVSALIIYYIPNNVTFHHARKYETAHLHDTLLFKSVVSRFRCVCKLGHIMCKLDSVSMSQNHSRFFWKGGQKLLSFAVPLLSFCEQGVFTSAARAPDTQCVTLEQYPQHRHWRIRFFFHSDTSSAKKGQSIIYMTK